MSLSLVNIAAALDLTQAALNRTIGKFQTALSKDAAHAFKWLAADAEHAALSLQVIDRLEGLIRKGKEQGESPAAIVVELKRHAIRNLRGFTGQGGEEKMVAVWATFADNLNCFEE